MRCGWALLSLVLCATAHGQAVADPSTVGSRLPGISRDLQQLIDHAEAAEDPVEIVVLLAGQGGDRVGRQVRAAHRHSVEALRSELVAIRRSLLPRSNSLSAGEEQVIARRWCNVMPPAKEQRLRELKLQLDSEEGRIQDEITALLRKRFAPSQAEVEALVRSLGGQAGDRLAAVNVLIAQVPLAAIPDLARHPFVRAVDISRPGEPLLDHHLVSLGTDAFHSDSPSIDGSPWDVAVIDSGVEDTNPYLSSHVFVKNTDVVDDHGTGVAGIYASTHSTYKGLAFGLQTLFVDLAGEEAESMVAFDWALTYEGDQAEVYNYSFSHGDNTGDDYRLIEAFFDAAFSTFDKVLVTSAGNNGWSTACNLTHPSLAFNQLSVANIWDHNSEIRTEHEIHSSSSTGPTPGGRRKPDIAAPGHYTYTTAIVSGGIGTLGGTSSAAPHVGAGALLLRDAGVSDSRAIRAILINTADAWTCNGTETTADDGPVDGSHWDRRFGWGYLDLWEAWFNSADHFVDSVAEYGSPGWYDFYTGPMYAHDKATLVWDKRAGYDGADYPSTEHGLTNLNLQLHDEYSGAAGFEDADLDSNDSVHQVAATVGGTKVVTVFAWDMEIEGADEEPYALATEEGWVKAIGPDLSAMDFSQTSWTSCGEPLWLSAEVENVGDLWAHSVGLELELPVGWTLLSGSNPAELGSVDESESAGSTWTVQPPAGAYGWYRFEVTASSDSYGVELAWNGDELLLVSPAPANDTCAGATPIPSGEGPHTLGGDSTTACDRYDGADACTGYASTGRDVAYVLHLTEATEVCVTMSPDFGFDASLYLVESCASISECLAGSDNIGLGVTEVFCVDLWPVAGSQDYYLIADAFGDFEGGLFTLEVGLSPLGGVFKDGFETGTLDAWSGSFP